MLQSRDITLVREADFGDRFPELSNLSLYDETRGLSMQAMALHDRSSPFIFG
jgi:hypothetical protein